jgi:predicted TPR repeat methyltransferase
MTDKTDLQAAYGLRTPDDSKRLYAAWADTYDSSFAADMDFALPGAVAQAFADAGGHGPVLDLGAGTGLCGAALRALNITPVDATDLSPEMLAVARRKDIYATLFEGNLLERLAVDDGTYAGAVSTGTFTTGHVGPEALDEVVRILAPGGLAVISVHAEHWQAQGFGDKLDALGDAIDQLEMPLVRIYGDKGHGTHKDDLSKLLMFRRAQ